MYPTLLFLDRPVRVEIVERKYKYICICTVLNLIYIFNSFCRSMPIVCLSLAMCFNEYNKQYLFVHAKLASYLTSSVHWINQKWSIYLWYTYLLNQVTKCLKSAYDLIITLAIWRDPHNLLHVDYKFNTITVSTKVRSMQINIFKSNWIACNVLKICLSMQSTYSAWFMWVDTDQSRLSQLNVLST